MNKINNKVKIFFDGIICPETVAAFFVISHIILSVFCSQFTGKIFNISKGTGLLINLFCIPVIIIICGGLTIILIEIIQLIKTYMEIVNDIPKLPTNEAEFIEITYEMSLTECLDWLDNIISRKNEAHLYSKFISSEKYAKYIWLYLSYAYEKYKLFGTKPYKESCPAVLDYYFYQKPIDGIPIHTIQNKLKTLYK